MSFAPRPGCPLCSIVSTSYPSLLQSPRSPFFQDSGRTGTAAQPAPQIVHKDDKVTVYIERTNPVSSKGHLVIVLNYHVPSLYMLSSSDLPLLLHIERVAQDLLSRHVNGTLVGSGQSVASQAVPQSPTPGTPGSQTIAFAPESDPVLKFNIGFIVSPFSDPQIPVSDHVHCHAYIGTLDKAGLWRKLNYSGMGWWAIDDLIAEIREQATNNRVKSAYPNRHNAPIQQIPDAGARSGLPNGVENTQASIGLGFSPSSPTPMSPARIPSVAVTEDSAPFTPGAVTAEEPRSYDDEGAGPSGNVSTGSLNRISSAGQIKRPMGPRTKDSGNNIQLSQVSSLSPSPEPVAAV